MCRDDAADELKVVGGMEPTDEQGRSASIEDEIAAFDALLASVKYPPSRRRIGSVRCLARHVSLELPGVAEISPA